MEHDEQVALFNTLALYEEKYPELKWIFAIPNGGKRPINTARKMKAEGVKAGVWDIFVPFCNDYPEFTCGLFIEMKFGNNKLTDTQKKFREGIGEVDYEWAVCYSFIEACHAIGNYLNIQELKDIS